MVYKMEVFSPSLELQGILETFSSLLVTEQAFKAGEFTLDCPMTDATKSLLVPDNIIWFYDAVAGIIESISASTSESGISVTLRGPLLSGLLSRRILWGLYNISGSPSKIMCDMVEDCAVSPTRGDTAARVIPGLTVDECPTDTRSIRKQSTGDNLLDFLTDVGQTNLTAFGVDFDPATPGMVFRARPGVNRTIDQTDVDPVYYGTELDDVLSSAYDYDSSGYGNIALVAGEGEGADRETNIVYKPTNDSVLPAGYERLEYIETSYGQYFSTDIVLTNASRVTTNFRVVSGDLVAIFGARNGDNTHGFMLYVTGTTYIVMYSNMYLNFTDSANIRIDADFNKNIVTINTATQSFSETEFSCDYPMMIGALNQDGTALLLGSVQYYSFSAYDGDTVICNLIPCKSPDGIVGFFDIISQGFWEHSGGGTLIAGPAQKGAEPAGFNRRETYVDARDLQKDADIENPMTDEEYQTVLQDRGLAKLSDAQLIQSFEATIRTQNPTYEYGKDFFLGDTITVKDDRLGVSVSAVVESVERSISSSGEDLVFTFGYGAPTITEKIKRRLK